MVKSKASYIKSSVFCSKTNKQETFSSISLFQKCSFVLLKVTRSLVKMLTDSQLSLPWILRKLDHWWWWWWTIYKWKVKGNGWRCWKPLYYHFKYRSLELKVNRMTIYWRLFSSPTLSFPTYGSISTYKSTLQIMTIHSLLSPSFAQFHPEMG